MPLSVQNPTVKWVFEPAVMSRSGVVLVHGATTDINQSNMMDVPEGDDQYSNDVPAFNNFRQAGNEMRDDIANRMWEDYIARRTVRRQ